MMALLGTPIIKKYFGKLAPISAAGVNSMDVLLPSISRYSGKEMIPIAILHGILIDISVPVFVSFSVISDIACDGLTRARMSIVNERQRYFMFGARSRDN